MSDSTFGLKIGVEGEREFKKALTEINREMRVLGSEMKLVASQFGKNETSAAALSAKNAQLAKEVEAPPLQGRNPQGSPTEQCSLLR